MKNSKSLKLIFNLVIVLLFLSCSYFVKFYFPKPAIIISKQESALNLNSFFLKFISSGNRRLLSSVLWISTIMESDIDHYKGKDLNSWMYLRLNSILALDKNFYQVYLYGGQYLSIIKDDLNGASEIYLKGLEVFPNDFPLLNDAIFHFHFEVKNYDISYKLLQKAKSFKEISPVYLSTLAKLEKENGNYNTAYFLLKGSLKKIPLNSYIYTKVEENIYSIKAERDLTCLNTKKSNCDFKDEDGNAYIQKNGTYVATKNWKPFILKK